MNDYKNVYEKWNELEQCRVRIFPRNEGESLWGRKVPDSNLVGLDNDPLAPELRWQDIVDPNAMKNGLPKLIHRRWNAKVWFEYHPMPTGEEDLPQRKQIAEAAKAIGGWPTFFMPGIGFVLMEEEATALEKVREALKPLEFVGKLDLQENASP